MSSEPGTTAPKRPPGGRVGRGPGGTPVPGIRANAALPVKAASPAKVVAPAKAGMTGAEQQPVQAPRAESRRSRRAIADPPPGEAIGWVSRSIEGVRGGEIKRAAQNSVATPRVGNRAALAGVVGRAARATFARACAPPRPNSTAGAGRALGRLTPRHWRDGPASPSRRAGASSSLRGGSRSSGCGGVKARTSGGVAPSHGPMFALLDGQDKKTPANSRWPVLKIQKGTRPQ